MTGPYDDIINLPHPTSAKHPRMPLSDRAAQFAPFAALSGHSAALVETARLTDQRMELDEDARAALDSKQQLLLERIKERPEITVTWFQPDAKKDGGRYIVSTGRLKRIQDVYKRQDKSRLRERVGALDTSEMKQIDWALGVSVGLVEGYR